MGDAELIKKAREVSEALREARQEVQYPLEDEIRVRMKQRQTNRISIGSESVIRDDHYQYSRDEDWGRLVYKKQ